MLTTVGLSQARSAASTAQNFQWQWSVHASFDCVRPAEVMPTGYRAPVQQLHGRAITVFASPLSGVGPPCGRLSRAPWSALKV